MLSATSSSRRFFIVRLLEGFLALEVVDDNRRRVASFPGWRRSIVVVPGVKRHSGDLAMPQLHPVSFEEGGHWPSLLMSGAGRGPKREEHLRP